MGMTATVTSSTQAAAHRVGDALLETAITDGSRAAWLGARIELIGGKQSPIERTGDVTLYDGSAGIALACGSVAGALERDDLLEIAVQAAGHAVSEHARVADTGLYDGLAGIGLVALAVGLWANDRSLEGAGLRLLRVVNGREPERSDLISGRAGTALAFLRAATLTGDDRWLDWAVRSGRELIARADRRPWGWAWPEDDTGPGLCGLAHGSAGPAWVLSEISAAADGSPPEFYEAIHEACRYERSWFDATKSNWPDVRSDVATDTSVAYLTRWCHGAAGIGLSRLAMHRLRPFPGLVAEAAAALQSSCAAATDELAAGRIDGGLTLCHGMAGPIELLMEAHAVLGDPEHLQMARWLVARALELLGDDIAAWPGGVHGLPGPGLMNGLAGALYLLARTEAPEAVRSLGLLRTC